VIQRIIIGLCDGPAAGANTEADVATTDAFNLRREIPSPGMFASRRNWRMAPGASQAQRDNRQSGATLDGRRPKNRGPFQLVPVISRQAL
jgi:hypothetical protein